MSIPCKNKTILYGNRGLVALTDHIVTTSHLKNYVAEKSNYSLPNAPSKSHHAYGINPEFFNFTNFAIFPGDIEIYVWCPAGSVLPHGEKVLL